MHIPYKGSSLGVAVLASGHIPLMTSNVGGPLLDFHRSGRVRILSFFDETSSSRAHTDAIEADLLFFISFFLNYLFAPFIFPLSFIYHFSDTTRKVMAYRIFSAS